MIALSLAFLAQKVQEVQGVRCLNCDDGSPGVVEWVGALSGAVGGIAAVVALILALRSAKDAERAGKAAERTAEAAERTAKAAEEEAAISREEMAVARAERARIPIIELTIDAPSISISDLTREPTGYVLRFGFKNSGSRPADRLLVNAVVPRAAKLSISSARSPALWTSLLERTETDLGRGMEPVDYWSAVMLDLDPPHSYVAEVMVINKPFVDEPMPMRVSLGYDGKDEFSFWSVLAAKDGTVTVERADPPEPHS